MFLQKSVHAKVPTPHGVGDLKFHKYKILNILSRRGKFEYNFTKWNYNRRLEF